MWLSKITAPAPYVEALKTATALDNYCLELSIQVSAGSLTYGAQRLSVERGRGEQKLTNQVKDQDEYKMTIGHQNNGTHDHEGKRGVSYFKIARISARQT